MLDVGYAWTGWKEALGVLRSLEKYDLFFVETPLPSDDLEGYAQLVEATDIRIAAGELLQTRFEFADLMDRDTSMLSSLTWAESGELRKP